MPVNWLIDWKAYRFAYEYDFISQEPRLRRVHPGRQVHRRRRLARRRPSRSTEFVHPQAPIPAIGGIVRFYIVPNISITGELTGHHRSPTAWPRNTSDGHYADLDIYGTLNFTNNIGAQVGYRSLDVGVSRREGHRVDRCRGSTSAWSRGTVLSRLSWPEVPDGGLTSR